MSAPAGDDMTGRSLGPWRLRPERQGASERVWTVSVDLGVPVPPGADGDVATIAWRRETCEWVLDCLPPLAGRASWTQAGPGDWPPEVPQRVWRAAVAELGASAVVSLRLAVVSLPLAFGALDRSGSGSEEASG